jgi:hypothetical protein
MSKRKGKAKKIMKRIHVHDEDEGGIYSFTTGAMGSGKTAVMLSFLDYTLLHHKKDKVFVSECYNTPIQVFKSNIIRNDFSKICFWFKKGVSFQLRDRQKAFKNVTYKFPVRYFNGFGDLYENAEPGVANIVFFGNRLYWMDFIKYVMKNSVKWNHFFIDELSEVIPAYQSGDLYRHIGKFADVLKDSRKNWVNVHANTQHAARCDHRPRNIAMVYVFLPGARALKKCRVWQKAIDNLDSCSIRGNQAYLEMSGEFGITRFKDIYKPNKEFKIDCDCMESDEGVEYIIHSFQKDDDNVIEEDGISVL